MRFSALQRAEIAEIPNGRTGVLPNERRFSALQRAEIAEMRLTNSTTPVCACFSALQRAEIAEIGRCCG